MSTTDSREPLTLGAMGRGTHSRSAAAHLAAGRVLPTCPQGAFARSRVEKGPSVLGSWIKPGFLSLKENLTTVPTLKDTKCFVSRVKALGRTSAL